MGVASFTASSAALFQPFVGQLAQPYIAKCLVYLLQFCRKHDLYHFIFKKAILLCELAHLFLYSHIKGLPETGGYIGIADRPGTGRRRDLVDDLLQFGTGEQQEYGKDASYFFHTNIFLVKVLKLSVVFNSYFKVRLL